MGKETEFCTIHFYSMFFDQNQSCGSVVSKRKRQPGLVRSNNIDLRLNSSFYYCKPYWCLLIHVRENLGVKLLGQKKAAYSAFLSNTSTAFSKSFSAFLPKKKKRERECEFLFLQVFANTRNYKVFFFLSNLICKAYHFIEIIIHICLIAGKVEYLFMCFFGHSVYILWIIYSYPFPFFYGVVCFLLICRSSLYIMIAYMTKYSLQICRSFLNFFMPLDAQELFSSILMQSNCQSSFTTGTFSKQSLSS